MSVTQKEIALSSGVSRSVVAKVLQGYTDVAKSTQEKVLAAARELGYTQYSNPSARSMIAQRYGQRSATGIVAVILPVLGGDVPVRSSVYFDGFLNGIEYQADAAELNVFLCARHGSKLPRLVLERGVDGVIALENDSRLDTILDLGLPLVLLDRQRDDCASITPDSRHGIEQAVQHLVELGHTQIAYLGQSIVDAAGRPLGGVYSNVPRFSAFQNAMARHGLAVNPEAVEVTLKSDAMQEAAEGMERLLLRDARFTAQVCYHDVMAMGAIQQLQAGGLRVPEDISVTGFDDLSVEYGFRPTVTSVRSPRWEMGVRAVQWLREQIESGQWEARHEVFPVELVVRDSTVSRK